MKTAIGQWQPRLCLGSFWDVWFQSSRGLALCPGTEYPERDSSRRGQCWWLWGPEARSQPRIRHTLMPAGGSRCAVSPAKRCQGRGAAGEGLGQLGRSRRRWETAFQVRCWWLFPSASRSGARREQGCLGRGPMAVAGLGPPGSTGGGCPRAGPAPSWQFICYSFKYPLFALGTARSLVNQNGDIYEMKSLKKMFNLPNEEVTC